jgi:hypothetical protein
MADASNILAASSAAQGVSSIGNAYSQAQAARAQGAYQKSISEINERLSELQAESSLKRGEKDAQAIRRRTEKTIGSQRAALAANGVDVNDGSALEIQQETELYGQIDELTAKTNAIQEAYGFKMQANNDRARGNFASLSARGDARNTLITGANRALSYGLESAYYARGGSTKKKGDN